MKCPSRRAVMAGFACASLAPALAMGAEPPELLIYCGITMVKPIKEIAGLFEKRHNLKVTISQGGSEDLYYALKLSQKGDIYFPGAQSYRQQYLPEGILGDMILVGHNVASLVVAKGNPKRVKAELTELLRPDLSVIICDPETGSIGSETKKILDRAQLMKTVMERSTFLATDSRNLMQAMKTGQADLVINWRATAFFPENRDIVEVLDLDPTVSQPSRLELSLLNFSKQQEEARKFMALAASPEGQMIFRKHGFLDASMVGEF